tara:strand:- start:259 stop:510 length:252 start_codon:yes stop_codon:yes gene_type:complete
MKPKAKRNVAMVDEVIAIGEVFSSKQVIERLFIMKENAIPFQGKLRTLRFVPTSVGVTMALRTTDRYIELGQKDNVIQWRREA